MKLFFLILISLSSCIAGAQQSNPLTWPGWQSVASFQKNVPSKGLGFVFVSPVVLSTYGIVNPNNTMEVFIKMNGSVVPIHTTITTPPSSWEGYFNTGRMGTSVRCADGSKTIVYAVPVSVQVIYQVRWLGGYYDDPHDPANAHLWQWEFTTNF
jgi:hypothetical protein